MPVMKPAVSDRNRTPSSTAPVSLSTDCGVAAPLHILESGAAIALADVERTLATTTKPNRDTNAPQIARHPKTPLTLTFVSAVLRRVSRLIRAGPHLKHRVLNSLYPLRP